MLYALIPLCLCLAGVFLWQESKKNYVPAVILKGLASLCFVILGFCLSKGSPAARLITVGLLWLPGEMAVYGNGLKLAGWKDPRVASVPAYLILYMVSGGWDNDPLDPRRLPADFEIDYGRAWQRNEHRHTRL